MFARSPSGMPLFVTSNNEAPPFLCCSTKMGVGASRPFGGTSGRPVSLPERRVWPLCRSSSRTLVARTPRLTPTESVPCILALNGGVLRRLLIKCGERQCRWICRGNNCIGCLTTCRLIRCRPDRLIYILIGDQDERVGAEERAGYRRIAARVVHSVYRRLQRRMGGREAHCAACANLHWRLFGGLAAAKAT